MMKKLWLKYHQNPRDLAPKKCGSPCYQVIAPLRSISMGLIPPNKWPKIDGIHWDHFSIFNPMSGVISCPTDFSELFTLEIGFLKDQFAPVGHLKMVVMKSKGIPPKSH